MNKLKYFTAILIAVAGLGLQQSQAHLLDSNQFFTAGPIGNPSDELSYLQSKSFLPATSQFLFKQNDDDWSLGQRIHRGHDHRQYLEHLMEPDWQRPRFGRLVD